MLPTLLLLLACQTKAPPDTAGGDPGASVGPWEGCPDASSAVGDPAWTGRLEVTEAALFCAWPDESATLESALADKGQAWAVPGLYTFPTTAGSHALTIPACTQGADGVVDATTGTGSANVALASTYMQLSLFQASTLGAGIGAVMLHNLEAGDTVTVNGQGVRTGFDETVFALFDATAEGMMGRGYGPCASPDTWRVDTHHVTFDGGFVDLTLHIGDSAAGTEPFAFVSALGQLDGVDFVQEDYYGLVYRPEHHHFGRHFAVLLPSPISGACALRLEGLDFTDSADGSVSLADCDLAVLSTRALTYNEVTRTDPPAARTR